MIRLSESVSGIMRRSRNQGHRRDLERSEKTIGQLYPILRDAKGRVIDGYHRLDANPKWKSVQLDNVRTEEERLIVSAHARAWGLLQTIWMVKHDLILQSVSFVMP